VIVIANDHRERILVMARSVVASDLWLEMDKKDLIYGSLRD
jgi:hypothetical protein